ncbi:aspartate 1-decarboxylase [Spiribacter vilamensis]|uniref:Aspartate 1-decarboxylase n=1 Tax=Spiribacter vilamensis TaxID=531306 RepID=A0A4Q8CZA4_9GAMM|nr:aspartate 1-decarboxylase [Spiribacter vilamensis]RZU98292.1 L-aspartate 1-decarboxylase [Spiribacter vilamensis]TVO60816.1 aspartate 1-decarboxylase [Spiribacter vilamensis]
MMISVLQAKIHAATVTDANLEYEGSITIDPTLLDASGLLPHQHVHVYNITNGNRFETYIIKGMPDRGEITINGAAAHMAGRGDRVIIAAYAQVNPEEARTWEPTRVFVDSQNVPKTPG